MGIGRPEMAAIRALQVHQRPLVAEQVLPVRIAVSRPPAITTYGAVIATRAGPRRPEPWRPRRRRCPRAAAASNRGRFPRVVARERSRSCRTGASSCRSHRQLQLRLPLTTTGARNISQVMGNVTVGNIDREVSVFADVVLSSQLLFATKRPKGFRFWNRTGRLTLRPRAVAAS